MKQYAISIILFLISGVSSATDWKIISSNDAFWIKTVNPDRHSLLLAYQNGRPEFLLILQTDSSTPDKPLPIKIRIDNGPMESSQLIFLEKRSEQSIFRIDIDEQQKENTIARMIAGLNWSINFSQIKDKNISFSLKGFTVAFNDLLIGNKIGSLDINWLIKHKKDREFYCLMTTNISVKVMEYRIKGKTYANTLHLIPQTHYSLIDNNLAEIIRRVYDIPENQLPYVPRAEKYLMFYRCMKHAWQ